MVALLPADGNYDLEQGNNLGDEGDVWDVGMSIGPDTFPNTDMYQTGAIKKSGITIEIKSQSGNKFEVQIKNNGRSGSERVDSAPTVFSAPTKEQSTLETIAQEQFNIPDDEELKISGKIPQLPWYDEAVAAEQQNALGDSEYDPIHVWDSKVSSASHGRESWAWWILISSLSATILSVLLENVAATLSKKARDTANPKLFVLSISLNLIR